MADMNEIVRVAVDNYHGCVSKYSAAQANELLYKALIEANNGNTKLDYKSIRDGKCNGVFALVEEILAHTVPEGLQSNDFFMSMVDFRNLKLGDQNLFDVEDSTLFAVADMAEGTQGIRRQRIGGMQQVAINTTLKGVKVYEELNRILAGQVDFNRFIAKISASMQEKLLNDVYSLWSTAAADKLGANFYFNAAGSFSETELLKMIEHVEAAAGGKKATIIGTKSALRYLAPSMEVHEYASDMYNMGYCGKYYGTDVVALPQRHRVNSTEFVFDNTLTIIAGDDKPIKVVYEGDPLIIPGNPMNNADLTQDYLYGERYGLGLVLAGGNAGAGRYQITA